MFLHILDRHFAYFFVMSGEIVGLSITFPPGLLLPRAWTTTGDRGLLAITQTPELRFTCNIMSNKFNIVSLRGVECCRCGLPRPKLTFTPLFNRQAEVTTLPTIVQMYTSTNNNIRGHQNLKCIPLYKPTGHILQLLPSRENFWLARFWL